MTRPFFEITPTQPILEEGLAMRVACWCWLVTDTIADALAEQDADISHNVALFGSATVRVHTEGDQVLITPVSMGSPA